MIMFPVDIEIKLNVCARDWDEAVDAAKRGLAEGKYTDAATFAYAHGDTMKRKEVRK